MHNIGVPVIVAVIALGKWLLQNVGKPAESESSQEVGSPHRQPTPVALESEEERTRRFMDALGLPAGSNPPARVDTGRETNVPPPRPALQEREGIPRPRPQRERRRIAPSFEPLARNTVVRETVLPREDVIQRERTPIVEVMSASLEPGGYRVAASSLVPMQLPEEAVASQHVPLRVELRDRGALRRAFILREIIGPAKALQSERQTTIFTPL